MEKLNDLEIWTLEYASLDEKLEKIEDEMDLLRVKKHELRLERDELGYEIGKTDFDENGMITAYN
tara:strand:+ start:81 stop:275 length:195 start_codon:yes stop_codon:yes gene_type:complete